MHPAVTISDGTLEGRTEDGVSRFLGIPYAAAPVGPLRWRAPEPPEPWSGTRDASEFGHSAPQATVGGLQKLIGIAGGPTSEDCLYINVWTPAADSARRPVLFWIHGGANTLGSGAQPRINGEHLTRRGDVVVVTFNYRLGALGFLHAPELGATGNEALLDQVAALRWVQQNIAAFGGDPDNVTAFGQSAGGFDLVALMAMPAAAGLFHKAGPMSGSLGMSRAPEDAARATTALAEHVGGMDKIRDADAEEILKWQLSAPFGYGAVNDGEVIGKPIDETIAAGTHTTGMPLLIGTCENESALWSATGSAAREMDGAALKGRLADMGVDDVDAVLGAYDDGVRKPVEVLTAVMTDRTFRLPGIRTADLHRAHTPAVWSYLFDYRSPALDGRLGSVHSLDIPFAFGTLTAEGMDEFCGSGPAVERLSGQIMDMWISFAHTGSPMHAGLPDWPCYGDARETMRLGLEPGVEADPLSKRRTVWA